MRADAKSYSMPKVDIQAQVETDGSLHVVEQRTFDFDGDFTAVWWAFDGLPSGASLQVNGVAHGIGSDDGTVAGEWTTLEAVSFMPGWRDEGAPARTRTRSTNEGYGVCVLRRLRRTDDGRARYTIVNGVRAFKDVGEVYWKYVSDQWAEGIGRRDDDARPSRSL